MKIEFKRLSEVRRLSIIELMNHQLVRRHMPLLTDDFNESACDTFVSAKEELWAKYGFGPWAFFVNDQFAGWGGLQPLHGEADLALVLHPGYWGIGKVIYNKIISRAYGEMGFKSVTVLFPTSRTRIKGLLRLGFKEDGVVKVGNERFIRYRKEIPIGKKDWIY